MGLCPSQSNGSSIKWENGPYCTTVTCDNKNGCRANIRHKKDETGCRHDDSVSYRPPMPKRGDIVRAKDLNDLVTTLESEHSRRRRSPGGGWSYSCQVGRVTTGNIVYASEVNKIADDELTGTNQEIFYQGDMIQSHAITNAAGAVYAYGRECLCYCNYCGCDCDVCTCNCDNCGCHSHY